MKNEQLIILSNKIIDEVKKYEQENALSSDYWPTKEITKVILLMKNELSDEKKMPNIRVLRAYKDVYIVCVRNLENTTIHKAMHELHKLCEQNFSGFSSLEVLGGDYGKGTPI